MNLNEYQELSKRTINQNVSKTLNASNLAMGLAGEAGETVDYLKKVYHHGHEMNLVKLMGELGDVLWYVSSLATIHNIELEQVAEYNVSKLKQRYPDGFSSQKSVERIDT
jgi:NTP pyrophosphatase (non-canonical NTP hydrolase)